MTATRSDYCDLSLLRTSDSSRWTIRNALLEHGWDVDHRPVRCGEDLTNYDLIIVEANDPRGPKTQHHLGALWALVQDWNDGPPVILNWDHWDIKRIFKGLVSEISPTELPSGPRQGTMEARQYQEILECQMDRWSEGLWQHSLVCAFKWGDHSKIFCKTNVTDFDTFDPSWDQPVLRLPTFQAHRKRRWVCAALTNHGDWVEKLGLEWPVEYYGPGHGRVDRDELFKIYQESWGLLSPKYYHTGSGYWRARLTHGPLAGCVTMCDSAEVPFDAYVPQDFESMLDGELHEIADMQREQMTTTWTKREEAIEWLGKMSHQTAARRRGDDPLQPTGQSVLL